MADLEDTTLNPGDSLPPDTTEVSLVAKTGDTAPDATTDSSTVKEDAKPPDFRAAVSDVIKKVTSGDSSSTEEGKEKPPVDPNAPPPKATTDVTLTAEQQAEQDKALPFHNHPRWKQVMGENQAMTAKLAAQEAAVTEFNQVRAFMAENDLVPKEVAELFRVGALLKNDPVAAREILHGVLTNLDTAIGEILPADLKAKVDDGTMDEATAKEVARLRFQQGHMQTVNQRQQQKSQEQLANEEAQRADEARGQLLGQIQTGVMEWESQVQGSDPDYAILKAHVEREIELNSIKTPPQSAADAVNLCKAAYDKIKKEFSGLTPKRRAVVPGPDQQQSSTAQVKEAPRSIGEIVRHGMGMT